MDTKRRRDSSSAGQMIRLFLWISAYRLINAWIVRTQFDPDEYWQTLEPAYCHVFGMVEYVGTLGSHSTTANGINHLPVEQRMHGCALTWEWTRRWSPPSSSSETIQYASKSSSILHTVHTLLDRALHGPVRSYVSIVPTYWYYLTCRSLFNWAADDVHNDERNNFQRRLKRFIHQHSTYIISKGPVFLHALLVAAPTDLSVWFIASHMNSLESLPGTNKYLSWPFWALVCSITSWFHGYALVRTYANSFEAMCLLVGISLLSPELFGQSKSSRLDSGCKHGCPHRAKFAFILGGLTTCVRFTALAAWIPVGLIISFNSGKAIGVSDAKQYSYKRMLSTLLGLCVPFGSIGVALGCCVDRWFYGFWAIPFLGNIHFNVLLGQGSLYGTHPFLWYVFAGIPAICGIMLPFFLWEISTINSGPRLVLLGIIAPYIALHSYSEHKEFRFLLPVLPLICILAGHALHCLVCVIDNVACNGDDTVKDKRKKKAVLKSLSGKRKFYMPTNLVILGLVLLNYPHLIYLIVMHQRGPIAVNEFLSSAIKEALQVKRHSEIRENTIHYLTGCHSAPSYSHLHIPNVRVSAWHLDCSPDCRSHVERICESDAFLNDQYAFVESAYGHSIDDDCVEVGGVCIEDGTVKIPPTFLVVMQDDAAVIDSALLEKMKMSRVAIIRHTIKSISWRSKAQLNSSDHEEPPAHDRYHDVVTLFSRIDIHFDHIEVYSMSY